MLAEAVAPGRTLSFKHVEAVRRLAATDKPRSHLDLPGLTVEKAGPALALCGGADAHEGPVTALDGVARAASRVSRFRGPARGGTDAGSSTSNRRARAGVKVFRGCGRSRTRVAGVHSRGVGHALTRRAQPAARAIGSNRSARPAVESCRMFWSTAKCPRAERDGVPIVTTRTGEILWVAGVAVAEAVPRHGARRRRVNLGATEVSDEFNVEEPAVLVGHRGGRDRDLPVFQPAADATRHSRSRTSWPRSTPKASHRSHVHGQQDHRQA